MYFHLFISLQIFFVIAWHLREGIKNKLNEIILFFYFLLTKSYINRKNYLGWKKFLKEFILFQFFSSCMVENLTFRVYYKFLGKLSTSSMMHFKQKVFLRIRDTFFIYFFFDIWKITYYVRLIHFVVLRANSFNFLYFI
jgi:hypothetical protein